jgi:menaquinone-dependent protoporphyrinogen oxidase
MRTLIIYASKYGVTAESAAKLQSMLDGETITADINNLPIPDLNDFDRVIIGSSVYVGQVNKKIKEFAAAHKQELLSKPLGIFICCGLPENIEQHFTSAFSNKLLDHAVKDSFGGELRLDKMKLGDRMLTKMMLKAAAKEGKSAPELKFEQIELFAGQFRAL